MSKKYALILHHEANKPLDSLKEYFDKNESMIERVRNKFAFHYDTEDIKEYMKLIDPKNDYYLYLSEVWGSSLYNIATEISGMSMINAISELTESKDPYKVHQQLYKELVDVSRDFNTFINHCMILIIVEHLGEDGKFPADEVEIEDGPPMDHVIVPYFVEKPESNN
ncbi:MAG: hypothetical protein GTO29_08220 [Candidatus Latescibacteria bacterium]|nr:hypothetical protein [Candidatus Latescibacterota bacterium]NIO56147.1 hypothetical protein [Candidatus Latescibacterota bacterium]